MRHTIKETGERIPSCTWFDLFDERFRNKEGSMHLHRSVEWTASNSSKCNEKILRTQNAANYFHLTVAQELSYSCSFLNWLSV